MNDSIDFVMVAEEIAEIARTTTDPVTGRRLMELAQRLLTEAGLPPDDSGGEPPPSPWVSEPMCEPA